MQHSIEQWIDRINAMKDLCIQAHRVRNEFSEISNKKRSSPNKTRCKGYIRLIKVDFAWSLGKTIASC